MALAALVAALVGVVIASASFAWQVASWLREGPRVKVKLSSAFPSYGGQLGPHHYQVSAVNLGRSPLALSGWGFELPSGNSTFMAAPLPFSVPLPHTLEGGHEASFYVEVAALESQIQRGTMLRPFVNTALGKVYGKGSRLGVSSQRRSRSRFHR